VGPPSPFFYTIGRSKSFFSPRKRLFPPEAWHPFCFARATPCSPRYPLRPVHSPLGLNGNAGQATSLSFRASVHRRTTSRIIVSFFSIGQHMTAGGLYFFSGNCTFSPLFFFWSFFSFLLETGISRQLSPFLPATSSASQSPLFSPHRRLSRRISSLRLQRPIGFSSSPLSPKNNRVQEVPSFGNYRTRPALSFPLPASPRRMMFIHHRGSLCQSLWTATISRQRVKAIQSVASPAPGIPFFPLHHRTRSFTKQSGKIFLL